MLHNVDQPPDAEFPDSTSQEAIELALDAGRMGVFSWDAVNDVVSWDNRLSTLFGLEEGVFGGRYADWIASLHRDDRDRAAAIVDHAMRTGEAYDFEHRVVDTDGTVRWLEGRGKPIVRDDRTVGVRGVAVDITTRKQAELDLAAAQRRLTLLVRVSEALGSTLELEGALDRLGGVLVPEVADFVEVAMLEANGRLHRTLVVAPDMAWAASRREAEVPLQAAHPYARAVREAKVFRFDRDTEPDQFGPADLTTTAAAAGMYRAIVAPLRDPFAQGRGARVIGVLAIGLLDSDRRFERGDEDFLAEVAYRTTVAVDRCSSYERERTVAERLQRALLPDAVPHVDGTRIAVRYRPSAAGVEVGGDWYDVVPTPVGAWVSVGDVVGRGVEAAAFMGRARAMLQALTIGEERPEPVLERFDAAIAAMPDDPFATVVLAHLRPAERSVVLALAGHPPPLVVAPDGTTTFVGRPQAPIGTTVARRYLAEEIPLPPGSTLVLYTDGLVERAGEVLDVGLARLAEAASAWAGTGEVEQMADDMLHRLDVGGSDDDVALVIVWIDPGADR